MKVGDRVFYVEHGTHDAGTIIFVQEYDSHPYQVSWDSGDETDWYTSAQIALIS
jgi:hypothetical protein